MAKRALITGITGQDGSYLAEMLLDKGYDVCGMVRRSSAPNLWRIEHLLDRLTLKPADLLDQLSLLRLVDEPFNGGRISEIACHGKRVQLSGEVTQLRAACEQGKVVSPLCEETSAGCAYALARSRDDRYWCRGHGWKCRVVSDI